jgi:hypothetical protein
MFYSPNTQSGNEKKRKKKGNYRESESSREDGQT